jgi:hypothetical protein
VRDRALRRCHDSAMTQTPAQTPTETPGGSVGCDVCGFLIDVRLQDAHDAWHRADDRRWDELMAAVRDLQQPVRGAAS